jgi:glycosyltransferase involved in cell wall biosynthesis
MASSRAVIIPSRQEPFGLVALEAMAVGKPVIAARVGGLPEVLADADAILVPPDDPAALAHAIDDLTARLERDPAFGARNRAIAARFSVARMTDAYLSIYRAES